MTGQNGRLPAGLAATPRIDRWLSLQSDGTVTLTPGKVEIGQGILTALAQICADELDIDIGRVTVRPASTAFSPNEGVTSGSLSISDSGMSVRHAAAQVRATFLARAASDLGVGPDELTIEDGAIIGPGNARTSYWELAKTVAFCEPADPRIRPKLQGARRIAGLPVPRGDIAAKAHAYAGFIQDMSLPGMLHGRVLHPPRPGAAVGGVDTATFGRPAGLMSLVRDGSFVGVVCERERQADAAVRRLTGATTWRGGIELPDVGNLDGWLRSSRTETAVVDSRGDLDAQNRNSGQTISRSFLKPFLAHASIGTCCAIAEWNGETLSVWSHTQGIYNLRADLATVLNLTEAQITVTHVEGAGCYGHNGADDAALDAVLLARAVPGRPVRLLWSREDELTAAPFGAAMAIDVSASVALDGTILGWRHTLWSNGHVARPGRSACPALAAAALLEKPFPAYAASDPPLPAGGSQRNAVPLYDFPAWEITKNRVVDTPLRTSSMRSLGAFGNVFAIESFMDELAHEFGENPLDYRLRHLRDERARAVLTAAADLSGWSTMEPDTGLGRGLAVARYKNTGAWCAVVAEVDVNAEPRATRLWMAVDVGEVINPDGVANQMEGGAIQATSWALKEEVLFTKGEITTRSWSDYPILRFSEVPRVDLAIMDRRDQPPLGAGEAAHGPTAAALANAIYAALGVRVRQLPITRDRILQAIGQA